MSRLVSLEDHVRRSSLAIVMLLWLNIALAALAPAGPAEAGYAATPVAGPVDDLGGVTPRPLEGERRAAFASFVADALTKCAVPGASVAVVQDGKVVFLEGFGVREAGGSDPVTPDTLMAIGSITKPVTATLAAALVDAGMVAWSTPVVDLLPGFALSDPATTEQVALANLLSGDTGLPRRDAEISFEAGAFSPQGLIAAVKALPLTSPLGERFHYSNQAFALGGYALAAADGAAPDDLRGGYRTAVRDRVLDPLGMERSTFSLDEVVRSGDYALPHGSGLGTTPVPISLDVDDQFVNAVAPAGAMWSTVGDLARLLQTLLGRGVTPEGARAISQENLERTWQPGVAVPPDPGVPAEVSAGLSHYGLGWFVGEYGGLSLISHSGGTYGFSSELALLPEANLGIAVLTNEAPCGSLVAFAAQYRLFELVFDQSPAAEEAFSAFLGAVTAQRVAARVALGTIDRDAVGPILGRFDNPALGVIELRLEDGQLVMDAGEIRSRLLPQRLGSGSDPQYVMIDPPLAAAPASLTFAADAEGRPRPILTVQGEPGEPPLIYPFARRAAAKEPTPATPAA